MQGLRSKLLKIVINSVAWYMVIFEHIVKSMTPSLSKLKVTPTFCFANKILDNVTATIISILASHLKNFMNFHLFSFSFPTLIFFPLSSFVYSIFKQKNYDEEKMALKKVSIWKLVPIFLRK
mgnify:CR=1 FL=1